MEHRQAILVAMGILMAILPTFAVGLRLWARRIQKLRLGADDYFILASLVGIIYHCPDHEVKTRIGLHSRPMRRCYRWLVTYGHQRPQTDVTHLQRRLWVRWASTSYKVRKALVQVRIQRKALNRPSSAIRHV